MHLCMVTIAIVHKCTILHPLMLVFFWAIMCKMSNFFYFAKLYTSWCGCFTRQLLQNTHIKISIIHSNLFKSYLLLFYLFFLSPSLCLSGCSHSHLTFTATDHQRTPHHASIKNTTSKNFFQIQVKQEISITWDLFGCREKHGENKK